MVGGREGETYTPTTEIITEGGVWGHRGALPQAVVGIRLTRVRLTTARELCTIFKTPVNTCQLQCSQGKDLRL